MSIPYGTVSSRVLLAVRLLTPVDFRDSVSRPIQTTTLGEPLRSRCTESSRWTRGRGPRLDETRLKGCTTDPARASPAISRGNREVASSGHAADRYHPPDVLSRPFRIPDFHALRFAANSDLDRSEVQLSRRNRHCDRHWSYRCGRRWRSCRSLSRHLRRRYGIGKEQPEIRGVDVRGRQYGSGKFWPARELSLQ